MHKITLSLSVTVLLAVGCNHTIADPIQPKINNNPIAEQSGIVHETPPLTQTVEFSELNPVYKFSGEIPNAWKVDYVTDIASINVYDPAKAGAANIEKSVIFIRNFNANSFLTLGTVHILSRSDASVHDHAAVRYEIQKKSGVANFPSQPPWRNDQHKLIDIRYAKTNPSTFYVIAYNPELSAEKFENFIASLKFHNDLPNLK